MNAEQRRVYINQIRRLQIENKILRAVVVEERLRRQHAYGWYVKRIKSKWVWMIDLWLIYMREGRLK